MLCPLALPRRYLVGFDPRELPHHFTDVLIVGGGIAGLRVALGVPEEFRTLVITKDELRESNSSYAQGGIAGVLDPEDRFDNHIADTLAAGKGLCNPEVVEMVVREAPERIRELIRWGTHFDEADGQVLLGREGGHSHARIAHALGDETGREIMRAMIGHARSLKSIRVWQNCPTIDLLTHEGRCRGVLVWDKRRGFALVWARAVVLATGGAGQLYRETTNPPIATADGHAMAYRAGVELRDMEFMQFHPTVLYMAGSARHLLTEALRGEGAHLVDKDGYRFMPDAHPLAELAPRDDVSQAIARQMARTRHPNVYLDLSHLDPKFIRTRFPGIDRLCQSFDLDITTDRIPVCPGAHYMIGGATVNELGRTSMPGLWAAGEVSSSGLHGANRLASNSLLEGLVYGARVAEDIVHSLDESGPWRLEVPPIKASGRSGKDHRARIDLDDLRKSLGGLMWRKMGITRDAAGLQDAAVQVDHWCRYVLPQEFADPAGWAMQNMLIAARLMIAAAAERKESRGVHSRSDFPEADPSRNTHIAIQYPPMRPSEAGRARGNGGEGSGS
ncbi:L-aspartate oxidase [Aquisphaera giovannonii]|uniref:L-aspartate oxidase n=1 Tax=Aquisphaera giovannonii TaxID=406548 RepID=A0A5B9W7H2_9BACT|nr:L-aspartate oxidase [Aquisphaera giovannonii]QEH36297.1 L-aspartate oxidase [Aquisphaera giovannonii]